MILNYGERNRQVVFKQLVMAQERVKIKYIDTARRLFSCLLAGLLFFYVNSDAQQAIIEKGATAELIFQSGFEGRSKVVAALSTNDKYTSIKGIPPLLLL